MRQSNYDHQPFIEVDTCISEAFEGYPDITTQLQMAIGRNGILTIECYPGVRIAEILSGFKSMLPISRVFLSEEAAKSPEEMTELISDNMTEDRVFGVMSHHHLIDFFDQDKLENLRNKLCMESEGITLLIGIGASLIHEGDSLIYADLPRWEIQKRYRSGELANWRMNNHDEDPLRKYKQGYFIEWRVADRHKQTLFEKMDYLLDTTLKINPKMVTRTGFLAGLKLATKRPFRLVPFFDPGVWGGQWMKENLGLDDSQANYAWCFDCVPEENSLIMKYGQVMLEVPSINLVLMHPKELLGVKVFEQFGAEFPIRFDFLDTVKGQNLSLQVHPLKAYIKEVFGMSYTQDESYYILDTAEDAYVYLGIKTGRDPDKMLRELELANQGGKPFEAEKYVNKIPTKKHDHFLIPAGTVHCSGAGTMVLEISATPYIFTFKLWDWDRLGMDGLPRPVHIEHGKKVIQFDRTTKWTYENLVNRIVEVDSGDGWREERTGLHELEFIETRRHWFSKKVIHHTAGSVNVLNLIEGEEAIVESPENAFQPFVVHFAETFIVPNEVGLYTIRPYGASEGKTIGTIKATVRI